MSRCSTGTISGLGPTKLQRQVDFSGTNPRYSSTSSDGVYDRYGIQYAKFHSQPSYRDADFTFEQFSTDGVTPITPSTWMLRSETILPLPAWYESVHVGDTYLMMLCLKSGPCYITSSIDFLYRFHANSFGASFMNSGFGSLRVHDDRDHMLTIFPEIKDKNPFLNEQIFRIICALACAVVQRDVKLAIASLQRFKWKNPRMYWYSIKVVSSHLRRKIILLKFIILRTRHVQSERLARISPT